MAIKVLPVLESQADLLDATVALGDRYTKTLGLLTPQAYRKHAEDGGLLAAMDGDELVGYALFGLPKRYPYVRLAHLCVAVEHRGRGVARRLVQAIRARHSQRLGIRARCRRDYKLGAMWTSLGFVPRGEAVGRGRDREILDTWWLDLGHADLFAEVQSDALLVVTVDHSVFADLTGLGAGREVEESRALEAGWLADLVELAFTPQLMHDVRDVVDDSERQHQRNALPGMRQITPDRDAVAARHRELLAAAENVLPGEASDPLMSARLQYVAETSCAGLQVLATRDELLTRLADVAWEIARVKVVAPSVVTLHVDELRQAQVYRPADLMGTEFSSAEVAPGAEGELSAFFEQAGSESGSVFEERLKALVDDSVVWRRELLRDGERHPVALYAWALDGRTLTVPLLRTAPHALEQTMARQLLFMLKRLARENGAEVVRITDPLPSAEAKAAAGTDGFFESNGELTAMLVDVCGPAEQVSATAGRIAGRVAQDVAEVQAGLPAEVASVLEQAWWPAKITDSQLPSFLVPIEPRWSAELFNVPAMLIPRGDVLGISREHVYYRSSGHRGESVPARLLWYVSKDAAGPQGQMVIGCSRLDEVLIDSPEALFSRFEHLGVYGQAEVRAAGRHSDRAMAMRFSDTELFPKAVPLGRLEALAGSLGLTYSLMSLSKINSALFQAVYEEGHRKT